MAANNQTLYIYRGEEGEAVPDDATHVLVELSVRVILRRAFRGHPNIVEVDCRNAEIIEEDAFAWCPSLRRVKMRGVTIVEGRAFYGCKALTDVECGKLEIVGISAFVRCNLRSINLPSVEIVEAQAFWRCETLTNVKFGDKLETIGGYAFLRCRSLERITLPLKDDMIDDDDDDDDYKDVFKGCDNLRHVDLLGGGVHEFVAALHMDDWKNEMNAKINSINQILPNTPAGDHYAGDHYGGEVGGKGRAIQTWIRSVLRKLDDYEQQHRNLLTEATTILVEEVGLPQELVINNILPCLQLPSYYAIIL